MNYLHYVSSVGLGQVVSLMDGMRPGNKSPFSKTLFEGQYGEIDAALKELNANAEPYDFYPCLKLFPCSNWTKLVSALYADFKVEGREEQFAAASLLKKYTHTAAASCKNLADYFGLPQEYTGDVCKAGYILAKIPRDLPGQAVVSLSSADGLKGKKNYEDKLKTYKRALDAAKGQPQRLMEYSLHFLAEDAGSHFINSIILGDEAVQVFVYTAEHYKEVCAAMDENGWSGTKTAAFRYFTSSQFCQFASPVTLLSGDPAFEDLRGLLADPVYHLKESIFGIHTEAFAKHIADLNKLTCVGAELSPVTRWSPSAHAADMASVPQQRSAEEVLYSVGVQGCISAFGAEGAGPAVPTVLPEIDYSEIYYAFSKLDTMSMLWSPYLSISQMYVRLDELWKAPALNKNGVKHLIVTADVIELQDNIDVSGIESLTLVCRLLIAGKDGSVPVVKMSKKACAPLELYCDAMAGSCLFCESESTAYNQLVFDASAVSLTNKVTGIEAGDVFAGRFPAKVLCSSKTDVVEKWRTTALIVGLDTLLSSAYSAMSPQRMMPDNLLKAANKARDCVAWLDTHLGAAVKTPGLHLQRKEEIARMYTRTATILSSCVTPEDAENALPRVPNLRYTAYEKPIKSLLNLAGDYAADLERTKARIESINRDMQRSYSEAERDENIRKMAQFMLEQNKALAEHEKDINKAHKDIIQSKREMIVGLNQRKRTLSTNAEAYKTQLEEQGDVINKALEKLKAEEHAKAVFEMIVGVTDIIVDFAAGIASFKQVKGLTSKMEKVAKALEGLGKFAVLSDKLIQTSVNLADHVDNIMAMKKIVFNNTVGGVTALDWEIFMNDCEAQVKPVEEYVKAEVANYIAILRNLTSVAQTVCDIDVQLCSLASEIVDETIRAKVAEDQEARLKALSMNISNPSWKPDTDYLSDLGQFQAMLQQKQNGVLLKVIELLRLQDNAMTFYYLSMPTVITRFDIVSIKESISSQALAALAALESYPYKITDLKQPITIHMENVPAVSLARGEPAIHTVPMTYDMFETLAHVRVNSMDIRIDDVMTDTGKCHVVIETMGSPMHDRGFQRQVLSYSTVSQEWHVVYDIKTGQTIIGTDPAREWGQYFTKQTPFQTYRIRLPKSSYNKGLRFGGTFTSIRLSFMIEAAFSPVYQVKSLVHMNKDDDVPGFVNLLKNVSITDGWDAVSFFSIDAINKLWEKRYEKELAGYFAGEKKFVQIINAKYENTITSKTKQHVCFLAEVSAPNLKFVKDSSKSALIEMPLLTTELTIKTYYKGNFDEELIIVLNCTRNADKKSYTVKSKTIERDISGETETVTENESQVQKPPLIKTRTNLQKLQGQADENGMVYIQPAFDFLALENISYDAEILPMLCTEITKYLKSQKLEPWVLGELKEKPDVDYLKVRTFDFSTHVPSEQSKDRYPEVLGIYMLTTTQASPAYGIRQNWTYASTWPISKELNGAVYLSADLLWNKQVKPAFDAKFPLGVTITKTPLSPIGNIQYSFSTSFTGTTQLYSETKRLHWWVKDMDSQSKGYEDKLVTVNFPLSGINFELNVNSMSLFCNKSWKEQFPYEYKTAGPGFARQSIQYTDVTFTCVFSAKANMSVDKDTCKVSFDAIKNIKPKVTSSIDTSQITWFSNKKDLKKIVDNAEVEITKYFSDFTLELTDMPMFAVSNILFPETKTLLPEGVYFPLDLVIIGNVAEEL